MKAEITRQPAGGIKIVIHDPPGPTLVMSEMTDPEVCSLAQYIYNAALQVNEWTDPVAIEFVDMGGRSNTHIARANMWRALVVEMLKVVNPLAVLATVTPAGHA